MSIPAEMPADVTRSPSSTNRWSSQDPAAVDVARTALVRPRRRFCPEPSMLGVAGVQGTVLGHES